MSVAEVVRLAHVDDHDHAHDLHAWLRRPGDRWQVFKMGRKYTNANGNNRLVNIPGFNEYVEQEENMENLDG